MFRVPTRISSEDLVSIAMWTKSSRCPGRGYRQGVCQSVPASLLTEGTCLAYQPAFDHQRFPLIDRNHPSCRRSRWYRLLVIHTYTSFILVAFVQRDTISKLGEARWNTWRNFIKYRYFRLASHRKHISQAQEGETDKRSTGISYR